MKFALIALALGAAPTAASAARPCRHAERVEILADTRRPPFDSGIIAVWALLDVRDARHRRLAMYLPYEGERQRLPTRGQRCSVCFHFGPINGFAGDIGTLLAHARIVGRLDCR